MSDTDAEVRVPLVAGVSSVNETLVGDDDPDVCTDNDTPYDNTWATRTRGPRIDWIEDETGIDCPVLTGATKDYKRCFELLFIEDVEYEGVFDQGTAVAIVTGLL